MDAPKTNLAISELTFSLFQRPLHPELFNIYTKRSLKTEKYETIIWATGCSHVMSVFTKKSCLTELIAMQNLSYMTEFQVEKMSPNLYQQSRDDLERFANNRGIFTKFPQSAVAGLEPFSYIDFEARRDELHLHTFHAFPDKVTIIKTQSLVEFH